MKHPIELHTVPEKSGVYVMRDSSGHVLYVGKAKNLRSRLSTYFSRGGDDRAQDQRGLGPGQGLLLRL